MNVLVLNLTRLGDLLQSQSAISGLAARGHRVGLVCLDNFAGAAELMRDVSALFPLRGGRLLARLNAADGGWQGALQVHHELVQTVRREFKPDAVINLTPSQPARLLAMTFGAPQSLGFVLDDHGFNADSSLWAAFLQLAASSRGASPFNVVDLFRRISGLTGDPSGDAGSGQNDFGLRGPTEEERQAARARLLSLVPQAPARGFVALQLGASEDRRRWPVEYFAQVAQGLAQVGYAPVLVGTEAEKPLAERLKALCSAPVVDLVGGTNLRELAAALCNCGLLITNDTGTMHLAAGLGVPCLAIFLCTAQPWDTGPGLPGCLCLEPDLPCHPCAFGRACPNDEACRQAIEPTGVQALALAMLGGEEHRGDPRGVHVSGARVWRTVLGADGLLDLESLSGHEAKDRTRLIRLQRALYRPYLDGEALSDAMIGALPRAELSPLAAESLSRSLDEALTLLNLLARQGELLARDPMPAMKTKFLATWQRVRGTLEAQERLALLSALWTFEAERPGLDLGGILALAGRFSLLLEYVRRCVVSGTDVA
ncbi:MAG TPA: glycosyltransferase family 9 protein [Humidesulfovibrio sp.]|uniref:glycosyltransferase family 9 protein n=1 Tax=Humidesulfovibrio sp. TaxID=2910988 RepID=UPI002C1FBCCF|nr:glycosyltransferase family 9 protein [Humidesulfovibrio sp.]HWR03324.1 glycosyltransferase family 9 protein [Humidesulfovibrio sp.]